MATFELVEYVDAVPEVRTVYDDIMATRKTDWINNFWKALGERPCGPKAHVGRHQADHGAGVLDPLAKEMVYVAVSVTNGCQYCIASHTAGGPEQRNDAGDVP